MTRVAAVLTGAVLLLVGGCRDDPGGAPPLTDRPDPSVERQLDDIESTLDAIESELNDG